MKKLTLLIIMVTTVTVFAQTPQAFKYQAVARATTGNVLENQNVSFQISILQGSSTGTAVYVETHNTITNDFGLVNLAFQV
ncbi:MAG: Vir protein, partial [Bacteroidales bacterium]|nr:Vir protein [Bacteroidales bacterium]